MKSVIVTFNNSGLYGGSAKEYEYFVRGADAPVEGDWVVTSYGSKSEGPTLARVVRVAEEASVKATKAYLLLISVETLVDRARADRQRIEAERKRKAALEKLQELAQAKALIASLRDSDDAEIQALIKAIEG
jgi:hypothetical protein